MLTRIPCHRVNVQSRIHSDRGDHAYYVYALECAWMCVCMQLNVCMCVCVCVFTCIFMSIPYHNLNIWIFEYQISHHTFYLYDRLLPGKSRGRTEAFSECRNTLLRKEPTTTKPQPSLVIFPSSLSCFLYLSSFLLFTASFITLFCSSLLSLSFPWSVFK